MLNMQQEIQTAELLSITPNKTGFVLDVSNMQQPQQQQQLAKNFRAAPGSRGLYFGSSGSQMPFRPPGAQGFCFGSSGSQMPFGPPDRLQSLPLGSAFRLPDFSHIRDNVILEMPSYKFDALQVQEETEIDIFSCSVISSHLHKKSVYNIRRIKFQLLNVVSMALMYSSNLKASDDMYRITLERAVDEIRIYDPEFILKVALYARQELHIRTVTNFLLSYAAVHPSTRLYLEKYFDASIVLPSDWIQVAEYYQALKTEPQSKSLPAVLRRIMKRTFAKFDEYQLAKYNRDKIKKKKQDQKVEESNENSEEEKVPSVKRLTLKQLIRTLHIDAPSDHVMCLLGKKYPESHGAFMSCGLSGTWNPAKAGKRMKLPIPETWETQISQNGNIPSVWESLIDNRKLPYMATLRNLKNLILSGISSVHHKKVIKYLENKNAVINSRQLPMQFYEAYKSITALKKMLQEGDCQINKEKGPHALKENNLQPTDSKKKTEPIWKREQIKKMKERIKNTSFSVLHQYERAISKALDISSLNNLHPIPGKTLVICDIGCHYKTKSKAFKTCIMMGLMCMKACEDCKLNVIEWSTEPDVISLDDGDNFLDIMMSNCKVFEEQYHFFKKKTVCTEIEMTQTDAANRMVSLNKVLDYYLKPQAVLSLKLDHVVFLKSSPEEIGYRMVDVMASFLKKYRQIANPDLLYTDVNFSLNSRFSGMCPSEKDVYLSGSSSSLIKFIAERSGGGGQLTSVENIDLKYKLESKKIEQNTVNYLSDTEAIISLNSKVPKWRTVRIFISSTFKDMLSERDMLIRYVFPELKKRAASVFIRIAEIDLRWGVTEADSSTKRAAELCLIEAQKSDLFVGLIGERYGTIYAFDPPDHTDLPWVKDCPPELSITELEMYAAALRDPKSSQKKAFFYFRNSGFLNYVPPKWSSHFCSEDIVSKTKVEALKTKIKSSGLRVFENYNCHWAGTFDNKPILGGLDNLGEKILEDLWKAIQDIHEADPISDEVSEEEMYQQNLIDSKNFYVGKKTSIDSLVNKIKSEPGIFVICGDVGSGKTTFCINFLQKLSSHAVIKFFVGLSPRSRHLPYMIQYICNSICQQLSISLSVPDTAVDIVNQFPDILLEAANCSGGRDIILLIDGLDHLDLNDQRLDWLPLFLPNRVKFACSASESSLAFKVLCERQVRESAVFIESVSPLQQSDREAFVRHYLDNYRKTLDESAFSNHMLKIVTKKDSSNPLYLKVVCDFLRIYASFENLVFMIQRLPSTVLLIFQEIIIQMENEFGTTLVQTILTLLCIAKLGLEDNDLHYILSFLNSMMDEKALLSFDELKEKMPLLEPENLLSQVKYCSMMHIISTFAYGQTRQKSFSLIGTEFEAGVKKFYLNKNYASNCKYLHSVLAAYYHSICDLNNDARYNNQSGFAIRALLYHLMHGCLYKELSDLLCSHKFLEAMFRTEADDQLLEYYSSLLFDILPTNQKISREIDYDRLLAFYDFVSRNFHIFHQYPLLVLQQALNEHPDSCVSLESEKFSYCSLENLSRSNVIDYRLATLCGFVKKITASAGKKGKPFAVLGSEDGYLKVLDLSTRKITHSIKSHFSAITCICYAGKNRICASSVDGTLSLWNSQDFSRVAVLDGHRQKVTSCCVDPSGCILFSTGWDNSVRLWSLSDGRSISVIDDFRCPLNCIDHHPIKQEIACGLWNGNIEIWDTVSMQRKFTFSNSSGSVQSIAYTPDGVNIIASFMQSGISIWSSEEEIKISTLKGHILPVKTLSCSNEDDIFVSGSDDCTLKVWSSLSGSVLCTIDESKFCPVSLMEFISDNLLAIGFQNSEIQVIDINSGKSIAKFTLAPDIVSKLSKFSSVDIVEEGSRSNLSDKSLVFGTQSGKLMGCLKRVNAIKMPESDFFLITVGNLLTSSTSVKVEINSKITALLHNSDLILCGSAEGDIGIFSFLGDTLFNIISGAHRGFITTFCFSMQPGGLCFLSTSNDNILKLWSIDKDNLQINFKEELPSGHKDYITFSASLASQSIGYEHFSLTNFLTGSHDNNIILWKYDLPIQIFQGLRSSVVNIACSEDYVLGCGNDGAVIMWSLEGKVLTSIPGIELSSTTLTFHIKVDDSKHQSSDQFQVFLAFVDRDGSIKITKPLQKIFCCSFEGHTKSITSCTTANEEVISCSLDGSVNLWKVPVELPESHPIHSSAITGIVLTSECEFALSSDVLGNLVLWKIDLMSFLSPLIYATKKSYNGGFVRGLSLLGNNRFVCAVSQVVNLVEKYFLDILSFESNSIPGNESYSLLVNSSHHLESEVLCFDSCSSTNVIVVGLKCGDVMIVTSENQKLIKICDDWLLSVRLFSREKTSDFFCTSFVEGTIKLYSIADLMDTDARLKEFCIADSNPSIQFTNASASPFAVYEPSAGYDGTNFTTTLCTGEDRVICCGSTEGVLRIYFQHSLKFDQKVHADSITGILILKPYIFTSSLDKTVKVWNLSSFKQVCQFHSHAPISCLAAPKSNDDSPSYQLVLGTTSGDVHFLKFHCK